MKKAKRHMNFFNRRKINLDLSATCTLECPGCERKNYEKVPGSNLTIEQFKKIEPFVNDFTFCGQVSDPIFNPHLPEFLRIIYKNNKHVSVNVAASHKSEKWFEKCFTANTKAIWIFGIDGLPSMSNKYRINQDGEKLFNIMKKASTILDEVHWQYIVFDYNREYIEEAKKIANSIKVKLLLRENTRHMNDRSFGNSFELKKSANIKPKCFDDKRLGYSSKGFILPCCWCDISNPEEEVEKLFNEKLNINRSNFQDIILSDEWFNFKNKIENNPPKVCQFYCGIKQETKK